MARWLQPAAVLAAILSLAGAATGQPAADAGPEPDADAAPSTNAKRAAALLARGKALYADEADFPAALAAFAKSHDLAPSWRALNGIGLCQRALGKTLEAIGTYQRLLAEYGAALTETQRANATGVLDALEKQVGRVTIALADADATGGTRVTVDGAVVELTDLAGPHRLMPGRHAIAATRPGHQPHLSEVDLAAGEIVEVVIALAPEKVVVKIEEARLERRMPVWVPWATVGGGALLASTGAIFALTARGNFNDFDDAVAGAAGDLPVPADIDDDLAARGERNRAIATGFFIAGGVAAGAGIALAILNSPRRAAARNDVAVLVSPTSLGVMMRF